MRKMYRVALILGLIATSAASVEAAETRSSDDEITTDVYVVNNFLTDVRVFAEDAGGRLHRLGRVTRGNLKAFTIPEELAGSEFRIKVVPSAPVWSPISDDYGVRTNTLVNARDQQVRVWLEPNLDESFVEIAKG